MTAPESDERGQRLRRAALWVWILLGGAGLLILGWMLLVRLSLVVVPLILALFPAAAVAPMMSRFVRRRVPRPLATVIILVLVLAVLTGVGLLVVPPFLAQLPALTRSLTAGGTQLDFLLNRLPSVDEETSLGALARRAVLQLVGGVSALVAAALTALTELVLVVVVWFCYLTGGQRVMRTGLQLIPREGRGDAHELAERLWDTVGRYTRALFLVGLVDAATVGTGLWFLDVPLVLPLSVLVFFGAFFPFVGALLSGLLAVLVALADAGLDKALVVLALVVVVQQVDGYIIQPLVMGKVVRITAITVIVSVAIGATLLGVLGAFIAVPVAACIARTITFYRERQAPGQAPTADEPAEGSARGRSRHPQPGGHGAGLDRNSENRPESEDDES